MVLHEQQQQPQPPQQQQQQQPPISQPATKLQINEWIR